MTEPEGKTGWAAMNRKERLFLCIGGALIAGVALMMRFAPVCAFSGGAIPLLAAAMVFFLLSARRRLVGYERICFIMLSAAMLTYLLCLRFIFITPMRWGYPLSVICLSVAFLMEAVISWRRKRLDAVLFGLLGCGHLLWHIVKWMIKFITRNQI